MTMSKLFYRAGLLEGAGAMILILGTSFLGSAWFGMGTMPDDLWKYVVGAAAVATTGILMLVFSYRCKRRARELTDEVQARIAEMQKMLIQAKRNDEIIARALRRP